MKRLDRQSVMRAEDGYATFLALTAVVMIAALLALVVRNNISGNQNTNKANIRSMNMAKATAAGEIISEAVSANSTDFESFSLTSEQIAEAVNNSGSKIIPIGEYDSEGIEYKNDGVPSDLQFTVQDVATESTTEDAAMDHWQIARFIPAGVRTVNNKPTVRGYLTFYIRTWTQPAGIPEQATQSQLARVDIRPGTFADYQIVSDGPLAIEDGLVATGRVHSNGYQMDTIDVNKDDMNSMIYTKDSNSPEISCDAALPTKLNDVFYKQHGINPSPVITTSYGGITTASFPNCETKPRTGKIIDLAAGTASFERMDDPDVNAQVGFLYKIEGAEFYEVTLKNNSATVKSYKKNADGFGVTSTTTYHGRLPGPDGDSVSGSIDDAYGSLALKFDNDVFVSGNYRGRITIATSENKLSTGAYGNDEVVDGGTTAADVGAPGIHITGNLKRVFHTDDGYGEGSDFYSPELSTLGLISQGDISLELPNRAGVTSDCPNWIEAAMVSTKGSIRIPRRFTGVARVADLYTPVCEEASWSSHSWCSDCANKNYSLFFAGSMASHETPILTWKWDDVEVGYGDYTVAGNKVHTRRLMVWDPSVQRNPPPFFPVTEKWHVSSVTSADKKCMNPSIEKGC